MQYKHLYPHLLQGSLTCRTENLTAEKKKREREREVSVQCDTETCFISALTSMETVVLLTEYTHKKW